MTNSFTKVAEAIHEVDPDSQGELTPILSGGVTTILGTIYSSKIESSAAIESLLVDKGIEGIQLDVKIQKPKIIIERSVADGNETFVSEGGDPGEVNATPTDLKLSSINAENTLKRSNPEALSKLTRVLEKTHFVTPIVVDQNLKVIDGVLRVEAARAVGLETVPAIVLQVDERVATFLRIVLNRSSEFQRWDFTQVDAFADENLNMTGYLEPYGIFSKNIVPKTFLGDTVKNYEISEHNDQQKFYTQSIGLAEWARRQREEQVAREAPKRKKTTMKNTPPPLFFGDLEGDTPAGDPMEIAQEARVEQRGEAAEITKNYDEFRGEAAEKQSKRRSSKVKTRDNRLAAEIADVDSEELGEEEEIV